MTMEDLAWPQVPVSTVSRTAHFTLREALGRLGLKGKYTITCRDDVILTIKRERDKE